MAPNKNTVVLYYVLGIATILVGLFVLSFVKDMNDPNYDIPPGLYPLLTIPIGGLTGYAFKKLSDNGS